MREENKPTPTRGVPVVDQDGQPLLDKVRRLRYTMATRRAMLVEIGGEDELKKGLSGENLSKVLLLGLQHEDKDLTVALLEDMVDMQNLKGIVDCMLKALGYTGKMTFGDEPAAPTKPDSAPAKSGPTGGESDSQ